MKPNENVLRDTLQENYKCFENNYIHKVVVISFRDYNNTCFREFLVNATFRSGFFLGFGPVWFKLALQTNDLLQLSLFLVGMMTPFP